MTQEFVINIVREAFTTALLVAAPVLFVSMLVGLIISILQAATSIQEFTLTFVPKIIVVAIVVVLMLPWMMDVMVTFTMNLFSQIPGIGQQR